MKFAFGFGFKAFVIFILVILMSWAVSTINSLILERQYRQNDVKAQIAQSSARAQTLIGPVLVVNYDEEYLQNSIVDKKPKTTLVRQSYEQTFYPSEMDLKGNFGNEVKKLGIYKALMYQLNGDIKGKFSIPKNIDAKLNSDKSVIKVTSAYISMGISDARGLVGKPVLKWNGTDIAFEQGAKLSNMGSGINAPITNITLAEQSIDFTLKLNLRGMERFDFVPLADSNTVALSSSWQHPHFGGSFLPDAKTQKIDASGFKANWAVSSLSSNNQAAFAGNDNAVAAVASATNNAWDSVHAAAAASPAASGQSLESFSVGFVEPINVYSQANRATKYGLLFIGLTFAGFFVFEILKQLRIHPAQYTLVGLAMALFYLLLISLSEHISFALSYLSASLACVSLLGYYLTHVLKSKTHGFIFASLLTALYGALYGILQSEDNALLMGSLLVFGLLALVMIITRKVDWYAISNNKQAAQTQPAYDVV